MTEAETQEPKGRSRHETPGPRRRRDDADTGRPANMAIPASAMNPGDENRYAYRWANDEGARIYQLTVQDDWDFVTTKGEKGTKDGDDTVKYRLGAQKDGSALNAYLLRKPKQFQDEDRAKKAAAIKKSEDARLKEIPDDAPEETYKPK